MVERRPGIVAVTPDVATSGGAVTKGELFFLSESAADGSSKRAVFVSEYVLALGSRDANERAAATNSLRGILIAVGGRAGQAFNSVGDLLSYQGSDTYVQEAARNVFDGVAGATMRFSGGPDTLKKAAERGDKAAMERFFGGGVMAGAGEVMVASAVRDKRLVSILKMGKMGWQTLSSLKSLTERVIDAYHVKSIDPQEALMVAAYLNTEVQIREEAQAKRRAAVGAGGGSVELQELIRLQKEEKAARQARELAERQARQAAELPADKDGQLRFVRQILDDIESVQRTTRDYTLGQYAAHLEKLTNAPEMRPEVAVEIRSRLKLHDCFVLMQKADGVIEPQRGGGDPECNCVSLAASLAMGLNHALDNESITFFLKSRANGIPVARAWDWYQDLNVKYRDELKKIDPALVANMKASVDNDPDLGTIDVSYFNDGNFERKKKVDDYVVGRIMSEQRVDEKVAKKSWELAKKLATATGENSVFNAALSGKDQMAEDLYLKVYRQRRDSSGRPRGPQIHINKIVGIGNSWLREVSGREALSSGKVGIVPLYARDVVAQPEYKNGVTVKGIESGNYDFHFGAWWTAKIHKLREFLLDRQPDPGELISVDTLQTAQDYFKKGDKDGSKRLKYYWVAGVLDLACSYGTLNWTQEDISKFRDLLVKHYLSENAGPFLKERNKGAQEVWDELMKEYSFPLKMLKLDFQRVGQAFWSGFTSGGSGGGGKSGGGKSGGRK